MAKYRRSKTNTKYFKDIPKPEECKSLHAPPKCCFCGKSKYSNLKYKFGRRIHECDEDDIERE